MFRNFIALITLCTLFVGSSAFAMRTLKPGGIVKGFSITDEKGSPVKVDFSINAKPVVVFFWASWSPRSSDIMVDLQDIFVKFGSEKLNVVGINSETEFPTKEELEAAFKLSKDLGVSFTVGIDRELAIYDEWGVGALPSAVLIGADGKVLSVLDGYPSTELREEFKDMIHVEANSMGTLSDRQKMAVSAPVDSDSNALTALWESSEKKDREVQ